MLGIIRSWRSITNLWFIHRSSLLCC